MAQTDVEVRDSLATDHGEIKALHLDAFPDEELWPLVKALLALSDEVMSLVAVQGDQTLGHVMVTLCRLDPGGATVALHGPIAVKKEKQKQGIGKELLNQCASRLSARGIPKICVLGDPGYYGKVGYNPERRIYPPYALPEEWQSAWQSKRLLSGADLAGDLSPPAPWMRPEYWGP